MLSRVLFIGAIVIALGSIGLFFLGSSSYQDSFQSRVYYFLGDYESAHDLSKRAYESDPYNKMAFTVYSQSIIALKYAAYINQGNDYLSQIDSISTKKEVDEADRSRIKMMSEIMIDSYRALSPSPLTDKKLQENARIMQEKFKSLHHELFGKITIE
ncbi:MAG: hypothetical protein GX780_00490 [Campylobacteraceae bacterium]|nr:hypothetical protein [Campylobacteraceae bacterium]